MSNNNKYLPSYSATDSVNIEMNTIAAEPNNSRNIIHNVCGDYAIFYCIGLLIGLGMSSIIFLIAFYIL